MKKYYKLPPSKFLDQKSAYEKQLLLDLEKIDQERLARRKAFTRFGPLFMDVKDRQESE